jgi:CRISPR/Cas system CSM-associated protein Csm2 small subunit
MLRERERGVKEAQMAEIEAELQRADTQLAAERARAVRRASQKVRLADEALVEAIRDAKAAGIPLRQIGQDARMSHEQVRRLLG